MGRGGCNGGTIEVVGGGGFILGCCFAVVLGGDSGFSLDGGWVVRLWCRYGFSQR